MGLTVMPNDDGTIDIRQSGSDYVVFDADDVEHCGLSGGEKAFLRNMLLHAHPDSGSCDIRRNTGN